MAAACATGNTRSGVCNHLSTARLLTPVHAHPQTTHRPSLSRRLPLLLRKRHELARALAMKPKLLLIDVDSRRLPRGASSISSETPDASSFAPGASPVKSFASLFRESL